MSKPENQQTAQGPRWDVKMHGRPVRWIGAAAQGVLAAAALFGALVIGLSIETHSVAQAGVRLDRWLARGAATVSALVTGLGGSGRLKS